MGNFFINKNHTKDLEEQQYLEISKKIIIPEKRTIQINSNKSFEFNHKKYKIGENLEIRFKNSFNEQLDTKIICKFRLYDKIIFGFSFNKDVSNTIPSNILFIQFGHNFNKSINDLVIENEEDNIDEIILGENFNQDVNNLPPKIKKISFGYNFNKPVDNLPNGLEFIKFGNNFNQTIDYLPCSLLYIYFGDSFNLSIDNLPSSIKHIELGKNFILQINNIPLSLEKIKFDKNYYDNNKVNIDRILYLKEFVEIYF